MNKIFENEQVLSVFVETLVKNIKILDIVKHMHPYDIAKVLAKDMDLQPKQAAQLTLHILKCVKEALQSGPNVEPMTYPVPSVIQRDNEPKGEEQDELDKVSQSSEIEEAGGNYINNMGSVGPDMKKSQFPPEPRTDGEGWPYDKHTIGIMDPKHKAGKRGVGASITCGVKKYTFPKPVGATNLGLGQPGQGGSGINQKLSRPQDGDEAGSGSSWNTRGRPGWSSAMGEFDLPDETKENLEFGDDKKLNIVDKDPPVGSPNATTFGGRFDGAINGPRFRRGF